MLQEQLNEAIEQRKQASLAFQCITSIPNGLPHPDVTQQVRNASREYTEALQNVARIIRLRTEHIVTGLTLEDLEQRLKTSETQNHPQTLKERGEHTD